MNFLGDEVAGPTKSFFNAAGLTQSSVLNMCFLVPGTPKCFMLPMVTPLPQKIEFQFGMIILTLGGGTRYESHEHKFLTVSSVAHDRFSTCLQLSSI